MKALILAEREKTLADLCGNARILADEVEKVAIGDKQKDAGQADKIWFIPEQEGVLLEDYTETIASVIEKAKPDFVFVEPTRRLILIAGRIAAMFGASVIPDVIELTRAGEAKRLVYGGAAVRREKARGMALIMAAAGVLGEHESSGGNEVITTDFIEPAYRLKLVNRVQKEKVAVNLHAAQRIIGVGRGIAAESDLELIRQLAEKIEAEIGCTRPIAEVEHWLPRDLYIGISGLILAPEVYLAIGISGQVQHIAGVNRSKTIIAIDSNKNAPIFKQADYGIVGDLYKVVPVLLEAL
ncbi:MAG TPA: electron transfer flavoprotein subunit alpha/FixB family protein [Syntrophomonas sp.]|nr:electron transfer flavoprotein subunit alpha/FixB family protein [Syntrophomonas sp.]